VFAGALALVLGALMFGGEYGWGTVKTMLSQRLAARRFWGLSWSRSVSPYWSASACCSRSVPRAPLGSLWQRTSHALAERRALAEGFGAGWLVLVVWDRWARCSA
jgi:hypothetical protein